MTTAAPSNALATIQPPWPTPSGLRSPGSWPGTADRGTRLVATSVSPGGVDR